MVRELTEAELAEVDRIIRDTDVQTDWQRDDNDNSFEGDSVSGTLSEAARRVRAYLKTLR